MSKTLIALHGFLGRASDWSPIGDSSRPDRSSQTSEFVPAGWDFRAVDLWSDVADYETWAERFAERIAHEISGPKVLLGYSMGGRLALHALIRRPKLFDGAMIVSANPGLRTEDERLVRREADEAWAKTFLSEPWDALMREWNSQAVFGTPGSGSRQSQTRAAPRQSAQAGSNVERDSIEFARKENDFDRALLAKALRTWSLGAQRDLRAEIKDLPMPLEFVSGERDTKFTALAHELVGDSSANETDPFPGRPGRSGRDRRHVVVPHAGHRVPWDAPAQFRAILAKFLSRW